MGLRSIESIFFDKTNDYLTLSMPTFRTHRTLVRKCEYIPVRTSFDLDPTQEWIQAHVAQTMNL